MLILCPSSTLDDIYHLETDDSSHGQQNYHNVIVHDVTGLLIDVETAPVSSDLYIYDISDTGNPTYADEFIDNGYIYTQYNMLYLRHSIQVWITN